MTREPLSDKEKRNYYLGVRSMMFLNKTRKFLANFSGIDLSYTRLVGADLSWADFSNANFSNSNLTRVNIGESLMEGANLCNADFSGADLSRVDLKKSNLDGTNFTGADLSYSDLDEAIIKTVVIRHKKKGINITPFSERFAIEGTDFTFTKLLYAVMYDGEKYSVKKHFSTIPDNHINVINVFTKKPNKTN